MITSKSSGSVSCQYPEEIRTGSGAIQGQVPEKYHDFMQETIMVRLSSMRITRTPQCIPFSFLRRDLLSTPGKSPVFCIGGQAEHDLEYLKMSTGEKVSSKRKANQFT